MKHNDAKTREEIRQAMQTALQQDDKEGFAYDGVHRRGHQAGL